jgi:NADH:ubiquinone oxidoreductase subunit 6 (subunit J)
MSFLSQLIIIIINYISTAGLLACGLLSLLLKDKKRKLMFLLLAFLFIGALSFVYYSEILFFITGVIVIFFFLLLYLFVLQMDFFNGGTPGETDERSDLPLRSKIINIVMPVLLCISAGFFIYKYVSGFLKGIEITEGRSNIFISDWSDISRYFFTDYGLVPAIITGSLFMSIIWFIAIGVKEK